MRAASRPTSPRCATSARRGPRPPRPTGPRRARLGRGAGPLRPQRSRSRMMRPTAAP
jgi:hypothetical protein